MDNNKINNNKSFDETDFNNEYNIDNKFYNDQLIVNSYNNTLNIIENMFSLSDPIEFKRQLKIFLIFILKTLKEEKLGTIKILKEWKQKYDQKDHELQQVKDQLKYISQSMEHAFKKSLQAKNLSVAIAHVQGLLQKTSPFYQEYCVEELQEILQKNGFYNCMSITLDKTKSYKNKQLEFTLKKYFLNNRYKRNISIQEAKSLCGFNYRTIYKAFNNLVTLFPMVFSFEKISAHKKALCLLNRNLFYNMVISDINK